MMPTRRDLRFNLPAEKISDWHGDGKHITAFLNSLSMLFPEGERFFMDSVRNYRDQITDPELKKAVTAFIGQEAMHGREHEEYNDALFATSPSAAKMERFVAGLLGLGQKALPKSTQLGITIALEHFTAIMADGLLQDERILDKADPSFQKIWNWHALEETEHKAVAYDVWATVMGKNPVRYSERAGTLLLATALLWPIVGITYLNILREQGELSNAKGWRTFMRFTFGEIGYFRKMALNWAEYFKPGFHPWDQDNRHFLDQIDTLVAEVNAKPAPKRVAKSRTKKAATKAAA
ncbi:MAG: metal-dependent hydrolase [Salinisphaeraceae bacterium]|nr:metal-dependent hydrolase [Salinisphaeraceae bacterium]